MPGKLKKINGVCDGGNIRRHLVQLKPTAVSLAGENIIGIIRS